MKVRDHYNINESMIDECLQEVDYSTNDSSYDYWSSCAEFVKDVLDKEYEDLTYKQRNWLQNIISDLG